MKECPYTASSRDVSENTPPSALEISLGRGFCTPREISRASGGVFSDTSLLSSVYVLNNSATASPPVFPPITPTGGFSGGERFI